MTAASATLHDGQPVPNLCALFVHEVLSLLATSDAIGREIRALRTQCTLPGELVEMLDSLATLNEAREIHLRRPLTEAGIAWELTSQESTAWIERLLPAIPTGDVSAVTAAEIAVQLRLLVQHLELKTVLAAESALLLGHEGLCQGLIAWADQWHGCSHDLRLATVHTRMRAFISDLAVPPSQVA